MGYFSLIRMMAADPSSHWSDYWASGRLTSLPQDFVLNYDGALQDFWDKQFSALADGERMLDVCTGNGAVAFLAAGYFARQCRLISITAVDAARIEPGVLAQRHSELGAVFEQIEFIGGQPLETLALAAASFDLISSQYGIEYCDWEQAAWQIHRLLRVGGRFAMVCHAPDSAMIATMRSELQVFEELGRTGLLQNLRRFLDGNLSFSRLHKKLLLVQEQLRRDRALASHPLGAHVHRMLDGVLRLDQTALRARRTELTSFCTQLLCAQKRLDDMLRVNRAIQLNGQWHEVFARHGLQLCDSRQIEHQGRHVCGTAYCFTKRAD